MPKKVTRALLIACCTGVAIGVGILAWRQAGDPPRLAGGVPRNAPASGSIENASMPARAGVPPAAAPAEDPDVQSTRAVAETTASAAVSELESAPDRAIRSSSTAASPADPHGLSNGVAPGRNDEPVVADALLRSSTLNCDFGDGYGGVAESETTGAGTSYFAGDPVTFLVLDLPSGKAQMSGGGAGSVKGVTAMRVTATDGSMNFSGITPMGEVVVTSIYTTTTRAGRYVAVQSRHGLRAPYHVSAQWFGACDSDARK